MQKESRRHCITVHYTSLGSFHYNYNRNCHCNYDYHYIAQHYTTLRYIQRQLHYFTLSYTTQQYTTVCRAHHHMTLFYTKLHYTARHYTPYPTAQLQLQLGLRGTNYTTLPLQLDYTTAQLQLQLRYTTLHPAVVVEVPPQPLQPLQKTQFQTPFGPSVDWLCHP